MLIPDLDLFIVRLVNDWLELDIKNVIESAAAAIGVSVRCAERFNPALELVGAGDIFLFVIFPELDLAIFNLVA